MSEIIREFALQHPTFLSVNRKINSSLPRNIDVGGDIQLVNAMLNLRLTQC